MGSKRILLKDFLGHCGGLTKRLKKQCEEIAAEGGRKVEYLPGYTDKEELVQSIRQKQGVADNGLVAVLSAVELCRSFDVHRNRETQRLELQRRMRKALHYYFYFDDQRFGLTQVRLMSWFPFDVHVVINGRQWLARDMDKAGIEYVQRDNCFTWLSDFERANRLAAKHPKINWPGEMTRLLRRCHPLHVDFFGGPCASTLPTYYWTSEQTEWATDIVFREAADLADMYPTLIRRGLEVFQSPDVMRFLGHKVPGHGGVHGQFAGEVVSDMKRRPEGVRLKHRVGRNSVKMYDKFGSVLRVETTLNDASGLKVYREKASDPKGPKEWQPLRKSVADLTRRADLSQKSNARYLEAIAAFDCDTPLKKLTDKLCQSVEVNGRRHRGLRPFDPTDVALLEAISRGEFAVSGFRNRDIRVLLEKPSDDPAECRRASARTSRKLALLRAHGLIKKIPHTLRYELTTEARTTVTAILAARNATPKQLSAA
jgi:DNA-binding transcriptional MerR regulator